MRLHLKYGDEEHTFALETQEDLLSLVEQFPRLRSSLYKGFHDLEDIANDMAAYLGSHHVSAWVSKTQAPDGA